jgi:hypothetical protein
MALMGIKKQFFYKPEYPQKLRDHIKNGGDFQTFKDLIGCSYSVVYRWTEEHPEFERARLEAMNHAKARKIR